MRIFVFAFIFLVSSNAFAEKEFRKISDTEIEETQKIVILKSDIENKKTTLQNLITITQNQIIDLDEQLEILKWKLFHFY